MKSVNDRFNTVKKRLGATTGASKGVKSAPAAKVKPTLRKGAVGIKLTKDF